MATPYCKRNALVRERPPLLLPGAPALPAPPSLTPFHFFSSVPASDCRHSWLPSHRLSSCFPSLRLRFVPLPLRRAVSSPLPTAPLCAGPPAVSTPLATADVPPFLSAAAFPARFARGEPIVSRSSTVVACVSCRFLCLRLFLLLARSPAHSVLFSVQLLAARRVPCNEKPLARVLVSFRGSKVPFSVSRESERSLAATSSAGTRIRPSVHMGIPVRIVGAGVAR